MVVVIDLLICWKLPLILNRSKAGSVEVEDEGMWGGAGHLPPSWR